LPSSQETSTGHVLPSGCSELVIQASVEPGEGFLSVLYGHLSRLYAARVAPGRKPGRESVSAQRSLSVVRL